MSKELNSPVPTRVPTSESGAGLLIVGHGTRDTAGVAGFRELVAAVAERLGGIVVEAGFLELAEPSIADAVARAVERGANRRLDVVPLVLFAAGHAKTDIPRAVASAASSHAGLSARLSPHLGCHDRVIELSIRRYHESLQLLSPLPPAETLLLMVGRGSHDTDANAEMARFARLRFQRCPTGWLEICFTAMAEPSLPRALEVVAGMPFPRIVVQPHLMFPGELVERVRAAVAKSGEQFSTRQWIMAPPLGPDPLLCQTVLDMAAGFN